MVGILQTSRINLFKLGKKLTWVLQSSSCWSLPQQPGLPGDPPSQARSLILAPPPHVALHVPHGPQFVQPAQVYKHQCNS